jgi:hypothetical protein
MEEFLGEVQVKLTPKGAYTWSVKTMILEGDTPDEVVNRLQVLDYKLKNTFPNYVRGGSTRFEGVS